ncbi:MAG: hypothetical protein CMF62_01450 [Magnetococcales bacterium]|nr:hypothetical protein [Magnetococcales bacterium]|tara:strand:- start:17788 stop:18942 length:1155 start_codon:yes stop_codon:yes gene_type:complete
MKHFNKYSIKCLNFIKTNKIDIYIDKNKLNEFKVKLPKFKKTNIEKIFYKKNNPIKEFGSLPTIAKKNNIDNLQDLIIADLNGSLIRKNSNRFIALDIINFIEQNTSSIYKFNSPFNNNINITTFETLDRDLVNQIFTILLFMKELGKGKIIKNLNIILTPLKKKIYLLNGFLSQYNVNSGSCYPRHSIEIWRKEEILKVLIHELVHYYELDFNPSYPNYNLLITYLNQMFNIEGKINPFEGYTDTLAILLHSHFISEITNISFEKILLYEINWSCFQCAKIINIFKGDSYQSMFDITIKQKSNILSYYILKASLLCNINKTIEFVSNNIPFSANIESFINLLNSSLKNETFKIMNNHYLRLLKNKNEKFIYQSLRMSCVELKF